MDEQITALYRHFSKVVQSQTALSLEEFNQDQKFIKNFLPHRDPFLFIDKITGYSTCEKSIQTSRFIQNNDPVFQGHFPGLPVWPGVLQIEVIGQTGALAYLLSLKSDSNLNGIALTEVLSARFIAPVEPGAEIIISAKTFEDEMFFITVGQCCQNNQVCSSAVIKGLI